MIVCRKLPEASAAAELGVLFDCLKRIVSRETDAVSIACATGNQEQLMSDRVRRCPLNQLSMDHSAAVSSKKLRR